jgi:hypothetical protein
VSRFVRMFKPQFADLVESRQKLQTVRPTPKRMPKFGDAISLRAWEGKPYHSKQRILRESMITCVEAIAITADCMRINGFWVTTEQRESFAKADGFASFEEMAAWFNSNHGLPFEGIVIKWKGVEK